MRVEFANAIIKHHSSNQVFITGDLGYMALEGVRQIFDKRFINAGVAEQNMISVAAAMAHEDFITWTYSISPFTTLRPYEQIRNDVCHHNLPVKIVGNGGGYGYGIMGATHHNLEDIAIMRILPNMKVYVPFIADDVEECVEQMIHNSSPSYLRLNLAANSPYKIDTFKQWRKVKDGNKLIIIGTGPILGNLFLLPTKLLEQIEIWALSSFPVIEIPKELENRIKKIKNVLTVEEHALQCGINELVAKLLIQKGIGSIKYNYLAANGYPSGMYGDQKWHQEENGMHGESLKNNILNYLK